DGIRDKLVTGVQTCALPISRVTRAYCAPGNAGTAEDGVNVPIEVNDFDALVRFARQEDVGLTVIGPEDPLSQGITGAFHKAGLRSEERRVGKERRAGCRPEW